MNLNGMEYQLDDERKTAMKVCPKQLEKDVRFMAETVGIRLAGSDNEKKTAEYLRDRLAAFCPKTEIEEFPVKESRIEEVKLELRIGGEWKTFPGYSLNSAPSTNGETWEAEVVFFDSHTDFDRKDISFLKGKAVILLGMHFPTEDSYRRMMEAKPAFLLMVDTRYNGKVPLGDGLFPAYVEKYGAVPCLDVAYFDAWNWTANHADRARLKITGGIKDSMGTNVVGEIPGTDPEEKCIYFGGHLDTQAGTPGADDNAIGCAIVLELAKVLSQKPHKNTLRFICFSAEEQLSFGSASYVRKHRREVEEKGLFMCNFDSCGCAMGWYSFDTALNNELDDKIKEIYHDNDIWFKDNRSLDPYTDLFPFMAAGLPGITMMRCNVESGHYYHHRNDNTPDVIDFEQAA